MGSPHKPDPTASPGAVNPVPPLFGANRDPGLVALEHVEKHGKPDAMALFFRRADDTVCEQEPFRPFMLVQGDVMDDCKVPFELETLKGKNPLNRLVLFHTWQDCRAAGKWLAAETGLKASAPDAPYMLLNDPVQQHLVLTGRALFLGMQFRDLKRMQVDIECITTQGYEFCNAGREGDRIVALGAASSTGDDVVLSGDEKDILKEFVALIDRWDPDVIEGHNIFNFDLTYLAERARLHKVRLTLGRDGGVPQRRSSRASYGERTIAYERWQIAGRHIVDTLFLVHAYDISHRSLGGFGLKEVAAHFGLAAENRTYVDGNRITDTFRKDPDAILRYVRDDVRETRGLADLLSKSHFFQSQMLPFSYQTACVRGMATKIDALMVREYCRQRTAIPKPGRPRSFEGGYTDVFETGVVRNVHHCDVRSLYPSLMLVHELGPQQDELGIFLDMLRDLRDVRTRAKAQMAASNDPATKTDFDALQSAFKIFINSFYGYLGFAQGHFNDFDRAASVTARGRRLLQSMIDWLRKHDGRPVEIDTDGVYFVPPGGENAPPAAACLERFREAFRASLPEGIAIEFDGEYVSMYSYKMKNYALLTEDGEVIIKGAALRSRGLAPFQRSFLQELIRLKLLGRDAELSTLKVRYEESIRNHAWPVAELARTERLQDSPASYVAKRDGGKRSKSAAYELAIASGREYRAGDQVSYYVTGNKKSVAVHEAARLVANWDPGGRDENVPYYLAKLEDLWSKFGGESSQGVLPL